MNKKLLVLLALLPAIALANTETTPPDTQAPLAQAETTTGDAFSDTDPVIAKDDDVPAVAPVQSSSTKQEWITKDLFEKQLKLLKNTPVDDNLGFFGPQSMMWKMERYLSPPAMGAGRALLLQISHPWVTAGIDEHSITRKAPMKRARATFTYILTMIFGTKQQALAAAEQVRGLHNKVQGKMAYNAGAFQEGSPYSANEVQAMLWVHATLWDTLMMYYEDAVGPVNDEQKEQFYEETKLFAYMFGIPESALPRSWREFQAYCYKMLNGDQLVVTPASKQLYEYLFNPSPILWPLMQYQKVFTAEHLPVHLREGFGMGYGPIRGMIYSTSMFTSRVGHKITPSFMTENPVYKEAKARIRGKKPSLFTRWQIRMLLGKWKLVGDQELPQPLHGYKH